MICRAFVPDMLTTADMRHSRQTLQKGLRLRELFWRGALRQITAHHNHVRTECGGNPQQGSTDAGHVWGTEMEIRDMQDG